MQVLKSKFIMPSFFSVFIILFIYSCNSWTVVINLNSGIADKKNK